MTESPVKLMTPFTKADLEPLRTGDSVLLSGVVYTARDAAHARMAEAIAAGEPLPFDPAGQVIYFVGPTPARPGHAIGSAGPTTATRMDPYSPLLIERGLRAMIGKGRRGPEVRASMLAHGCVYFGAIEGTAALLARRVRSSELVAYADLETEAIRRLEVVDFPVMVVNDLTGGDLYEEGPQQWRRDRRSSRSTS
jgi:fumarate hydratase subunit beta